MKNHLAKISLFALVTAALIAVPVASRAADSTNTPATTTPAAKRNGLPFRGTVASVDPAAMTFTVGKLTIAVTSATKITKDGTPATFADITAAAVITGSYKKDAAGKLNATTVRLGGKTKKAAPAA
jgi:hypothetical protein